MYRLELYCAITSSSVVLKMSLPMTGSTSANDTRASDVGDEIRGSVFRKRRKVAEGWRSAEERKVWSGRRKETRFSGEPACVGQYMPTFM